MARAAASAAAILLAACSTDPLTDRQVHPDAVPFASATETMRLGGMNAPDELSFQSEPQLHVTPDGDMYVLHPQRGQVAVLDSAGRLRHWIGRRGQGPGEFELAAAMGFVGDTLWVRNVPAPRISRFLADGTHLDTERAPWDYGYSMSTPSGISGYLAGDRAWVEPASFVVGATGTVQLPVLLGDRGMTAADTLFTVANPRGRLAGLAFAPIAMPPFHDVAPEGSRMIVVTWSDETPEEVRIRVVAPSGDEMAEHTLQFPALPVGRQVRDSILDAGVTAIASLAERLRAQGIPEGSFRASITRDEVAREVYLPTHFPPVRRVLAGGDGSIWLERTDGTRLGPWLVLGDDGDPLFQLRLPDGATPRFVTSGTVWSTTRDELDIPYLMRWSIWR